MLGAFKCREVLIRIPIDWLRVDVVDRMMAWFCRRSPIDSRSRHGRIFVVDAVIVGIIDWRILILIDVAQVNHPIMVGLIQWHLSIFLLDKLFVSQAFLFAPNAVRVTEKFIVNVRFGIVFRLL